MTAVRWNIAVSPDTDQSVRMFLAAQGGGRKGDLSRLIEQAVRSYLFEQAVGHAKAATAGMSEGDLLELIEDAIDWSRDN
jgi:hypothetical protein